MSNVNIGFFCFGRSENTLFPSSVFEVDDWMESDSDGPSVNGLLEIPGVAVLFLCSEVEIDGFEEFVGFFVAGVGGGRVEDGISKNWPDDDGSNFLT